MVTMLTVLFLAALAVVLISLTVKAARIESAAGRRGWRGRRAPDGQRPADVRELLTDEDREYIEESWKNVEGIFPYSPEVALDVAHNTVGSVLHARGVEPEQLPAGAAVQDGASEPPEPASLDELRDQLLRYEHIVSELTGAAPRA